MNRYETLIDELGALIKASPVLTGLPDVVVQIDRTQHAQFGDLSTNIALQSAKQLGQNPLAVAETIVASLESDRHPAIAKIEVAPPGFINIFLSDAYLLGTVEAVLKEGVAYGSSQQRQSERWVIEHTSPNPNKAMHLGHLRNNLVGMSLVGVLKARGATVSTDAIYNDRGIAIAKLMYGFLAHMKKVESRATEVETWAQHRSDWFTPDEKAMRPDIFVTQCYVLGEQSFKADPEAEAYTRSLVVRWEKNDQVVWQLWEHVLSYAYAGINATLARLGSHWDKVWYEHEHYTEGKQYVEEGLDKGVFQKLEDGAVLTKLDAYNIPDTVLLKRDGTSLYITQDIALTALKKETYQADKLVWIVGPEQSLALRQLFAVCEQLGVGSLDAFSHVSYGYVGLKADDGGFKKMSSREGTVVLIDDVINEVRQRVIDGVSDTAKGDMSLELAETLALAAVKFSILKSDRTQDLTFDINQSVDTQGDSGVYVMYSLSRTNSLLERADTTPIVTHETMAEERELVRSLLFYSHALAQAEQSLSVHHVATYLLEVCSAFNAWYAKETILDGSKREAYKLAIVKATGQVIANGLGVMGIETVERM